MTKIIQRHDTAANWTSVNPVLAAGEMGVETDTNKFKFGDGTTAWSGLAYAAGEGGGGSGTTLTSADGTTTYSKLALGDNLVVIPPELPWTNPQMTSNSQDGYVASASATSSTSNGPYRAFDKDITGQDLCWYTGSIAMPQWIMLECPEPVRLTSCMIMNEVKTPESFKSGYIQGSNDGSTFDTLYTITDRDATSGLQTTYQINTETYYKYLRVYCTATSGSGLSIQEIEFSGFVKDATAVPVLNANLNEVTEQVSTLESTKQDKLTAEAPLKIYVDDKAAYRVTAINGEINTTDNTFTGTSTGYLIGKNQDLGFNLADYNTWEFRTKIRFATNKAAQQTIVALSPTSLWFDIHNNTQMKWSISTNGTSLNVDIFGGAIFDTNAIYYIRLRFTGTQYIMERSTTGFDNMTTIETKSSSTKVYSAPIQNLRLIAANPAYGSTIFLEDTCFIGNGEVIWKAYDESKSHELKITSNNLMPGSAIKIEDNNVGVAVFDKSKFTIVGSPTITDDGITSGFSASDYIQINDYFANKNTFKCNLLINTPDTSTTTGSGFTGIISSKTVRGIDIAYHQVSQQILIYLSSNGSSWDISSGIALSNILWNRTYIINFEKNSTKYYCEAIDVSTGHIVDSVTINNANNITSTTGALFIGQARELIATENYKGSIDLSHFSITSDGEQVFSGTKTLYQALDAKQENVKTLTGYSDTGTLVLKSINGVLQWVAES